ncbi:MAG: hypothetical protein R3A52_21545 [Polyangiales bacterium]
MSPASTRPGPTSTKVSTPSATIRATLSRQRTAPVTCRTRSDRTREGSALGAASTLVTTGAAKAPTAT